MKEIVIGTDTQHAISNDLANHYRVIPKQVSEHDFIFFIDENRNQEETIEELELLLGKGILLESAPTAVIEKGLALYYRKERQFHTSKSFSVDNSDFLENLLSEAKSLKSSDIHFEIYEQSARIRFRIDGQLIER